MPDSSMLLYKLQKPQGISQKPKGILQKPKGILQKPQCILLLQKEITIWKTNNTN